MKKYSFLFLILSAFMAFSQEYTSRELNIIRSGNVQTALPIMQTTDSEQHAVLLEPSEDANPLSPDTEILVNRMRLSLLSTSSGVGIACPQVGINRNIIWVKRFDKKGKPLEYFINPKIIWKSAILNFDGEGDLSIPDFWDEFYRSKVIQLEYFDLKGEKHAEIVEGFTAVIFQHEIDHLFGILISDKKEKQKKEVYKEVKAFEKVD
ncbi:MAG: peptide deformylase [Bergeyella sp.]